MTDTISRAVSNDYAKILNGNMNTVFIYVADLWNSSIILIISTMDEDQALTEIIPLSCFF